MACPEEDVAAAAELSQTVAQPRLSGDFGAVYRQHARAVYSFFYHQVGSIEDAEDLTATAFSTALANVDRYVVSRGTVAAWLFGIARNCLRDHHRRSRRQEPLPVDLTDRQALPEARVLRAERAAAIHRAIQQLPADQREALALRFFAELRTADVAAVMGKHEGAVKMLVHRAVVTLRDQSRREGWR
jgi:RNA polymerase sigma-70 factor (ECF subfamily)